MDWIKAILPLLGVTLGWLLSERGKIFADKRQDKRKLKKLLFFLLELRYHFTKELSTELDIDKFITLLSNKLADKIGIDKNDPEFNIGINTWRPIIEQMISKNKTHDNKFDNLTENIDKILIELAEIYPILAYELNGQHNIKERLNKANDYLNEVQSISAEIPFDIKEWINPKLTEDLLKDLDESINRIAGQIDKQTLKDSIEKIHKMTFEEDEEEMEVFINEYLEKVIDNLL
ncbi:MAG: hypothetical protein GC181_10095 [Bacteroidetes bacterium]|nr:hypothetical protein [Bacteroidota bacterium]